QIVVVVTNHSFGEGAPHAAVPVQLAIAVKQPDARMVSRDGLRGAVRAVVIENEDVEGNAGRPLGEQGIQARERQIPTIVHCHDRGDTNAGHLGSLRRVTFVYRVHPVAPAEVLTVPRIMIDAWSADGPSSHEDADSESANSRSAHSHGQHPLSPPV